MNIFLLDDNIQKCAEYHCDRHVVKMILEYAQLLSTACRANGLEMGYKQTHLNHPSAKWARASEDNFLWLADLAGAVNDEYKHRYGHKVNHKSYDVICTLELPDLPKIGLTELPKCMPDQYKVDSVVQSYRNYYCGDKASFATWKNRNQPEWFKYEMPNSTN